MSTWTTTPEASALIADCAATPPSGRWATVAQTCAGGEIQGWRYSRRDPRIKQLDAIHDQAWRDMLDRYEAGEITREQGIGIVALSPDQAIEAAIEAMAGQRVAA